MNGVYNVQLPDKPVELNLTKNSSYVGEEYVTAVRYYNIVIFSGRFQIKSQKPAGQSYSLFTVLPIPAESTVVAVYTNSSNSAFFLINSGGELTSNESIPTGYYNISCAYVCQL